MIREIYFANTSHVDITWWDTPEKCAARIVEVMDEALRLTAADPEYRFSVESVYAVRAFLDARPEREDELRRRLEEGRMDVGGLYVAPVSDYCFDEMLYRNFTFGKQWLLDRLGWDTPLAREEDSPGHTRQFPQLCRGFGMRWARFSRGPLRLFRWEGPDGSDVLAYTAGYSWAYFPRMGRTMQERLRKGIPKRVRHAEERKYRDSILMLIDGDDNALPNAELTRFISEWNGRGGEPPARMATMSDFYRAAEEEEPEVHSGDIPNMWAQIAVFEPDVFAVACELRPRLPVIELCMTLPWWQRDGELVQRLEAIWRTYLECMDHNWGGRLQGAYGLVCDLHKLSRINEARATLADIFHGATKNAFGDASASDIVVLNSLSCARSEPVEVSLPMNNEPEQDTSFVAVDANGVETPLQEIDQADGETGKNFVFIADSVPACGYKAFSIRASADEWKKGSPRRDPHVLENDFYRVVLRAGGGGLESIFDKTLQKEIIADASGQPLDLFGIRFHFNEVWALGFRFNAAPEGFYDDPNNEGKVGENVALSGEIVTAGDRGGRVMRGADGPVFVSSRTRVPFLKGSVVEQEVILYHRAKRIDLRTVIHWAGAEDYLLNIAFPFGPEDGEMTMDVPYGVHRFGDEVPGFWGKLGKPNPTLRSVGRALPPSVARWLRRNFLEGKDPTMARLKEKLAQMMMKEDSSTSRGLYNWLDVSNGDWGATLLTRHAPADFTFGTSASLFASVRDSAFFNGDHYLRVGSHSYTYSITSHEGDWKSAGTHQWGRAATAPLTSVRASSADRAPEASVISCDSPNIIITAVKPAPNGECIVRFYESCGEGVTAAFTSSFPMRRAALCDMMERETNALDVMDGRVSVDVAPYKIMNLKIVLGT